jgi:ketosteroid isomerase-like protein
MKMTTPNADIVALETRFWQAMVDDDADTAVELLCEPAVMVSSHGAFKFDHAGYRKMADQGPMVVTSFKFDDMQVVFPNDDTAVLTYKVTQGVAPRGKKDSTSQEMNDTSTWVREGGEWKCVMHTETPAQGKGKPN